MGWSAGGVTGPSGPIALSADSTLIGERVLTPGAGISFVDDGPDSTLTISAVASGIDHNSLANLTVGDVHTHYALVVGRVGEDLTVQGKVIVSTVGPSASQQHTLPVTASDTVALLAATQTLAAKTLTTPTIASFTNATHDHTNAAGGGTLNASAIAAGTLAQARGGTGLDSSAVTNGQLLIGNTTSNVFNLATLSAGTDISIVNAGGSITINSTAGASMTYVALTDTPGSIAANRVVHGNAGGTALTDGEEVNILSTGELLVGRATVPTSVDVLGVGRNQNAQTGLTVINETDGISAATLVAVRAAFGGSTFTGAMMAVAALNTAGGGRIARSVEFLADGTATGGLNIRHIGAFPVFFTINGTKEAEFLSGGGLSLNVGVKSLSATEIGLQVTNAALTIGSLGSVILPVKTDAGAPNDAAGGNLDGAAVVNTNEDALYVRSGGAYQKLPLEMDFWQVNAEASNPTVSGDRPAGTASDVNAVTDTLTAGLKVLRYDDTAEEIRSLGTRRIKAGALTLDIKVLWRAQSLPGNSTSDIGWKLYWREIPVGGAASATWAATNDGSKVLDQIDNITDDTDWHESDSGTVTFASETLLADREYEFGISRILPTGGAGSKLTGDWDPRRYTMTLKG